MLTSDHDKIKWNMQLNCRDYFQKFTPLYAVAAMPILGSFDVLGQF